MIKKVLILGVTGMLGHVLLRELGDREDLDVRGVARHADSLENQIPDALARRVITGVDATNFKSVRRVIWRTQPDIVVNCIGVIKQDPRVGDSVTTVAVNSLFPHLLARECAERGVRLVHVSTDCVFSGVQGDYSEDSVPDPVDFYGRSKLLGEVPAPALVLRTSIIGHELRGNRSLIDWFLKASGTVRGFTRAIYTGVTTFEFARLLADVVIPDERLTGLLHVASDKISKYDLLGLVAKEYDWQGSIVPSEDVVCDRSMRADRFFELTGYRAPDWPTMIREMREHSTRWGAPVQRLANA
ncbi:dTDP-4-dehydrorhamnose reductase family protein [Krasilnikovia sp. MM14-A1004]|uniref:dTDP-4-dehydrorhamnose reductase family protein n=1 Tax=Krasilnikovia sp. MM14-A1004 TaxID=3373541 RepID=UPI00399CD0E7